jgi:hypothetical protein
MYLTKALAVCTKCNQKGEFFFCNAGNWTHSLLYKCCATLEFCSCFWDRLSLPVPRLSTFWVVGIQAWATTPG